MVSYGVLEEFLELDYERACCCFACLQRQKVAEKLAGSGKALFCLTKVGKKRLEYLEKSLVGKR